MCRFSANRFLIFILILKMPDIIISDTSTLILFEKIEELILLKKIYGKLIITPEIAQEFGSPLPIWIEIKEVLDKRYQSLIETQVDKGEASAIALALELNNPLLLLDDLKARKLANQLKLKFTGTLGIVHKAKQIGLIDKVKPHY